MRLSFAFAVLALVCAESELTFEDTTGECSITKNGNVLSVSGSGACSMTDKLTGTDGTTMDVVAEIKSIKDRLTAVEDRQDELHPVVVYRPVVVQPISSNPTSLQMLRDICPAGYDLVDVQDADHIKWLEQQAKIQAPNMCTEQNGIALGWDFSAGGTSNTYKSFMDPTRDITKYFNTLRANDGWTSGDHHTAQSGQHMAGLGGWPNYWPDVCNTPGLSDWPFTSHDCKGSRCNGYVMCEQPAFNPVTLVAATGTLSTLASYQGLCTAIGKNLVSVQSAAHIRWLVTQSRNQQPSACSHAAGIPLGYDYNNNNSYQDLMDSSRDITPFFTELVSIDGYTGEHAGFQSGQAFAGIKGWPQYWSDTCTNPGLADWPAGSPGGDCHSHGTGSCTSFVICE